MPCPWIRNCYPAAFLSSAALALALAAPLCAQAPTPPVPSTPATPDWSLLRKAIAAVQSAPASQSESDVLVTGAQASLTFTAKEHIKITFKGAKKFRSEVTLIQPDGTPGARYTVISDGTKVWTYRPGTGQYSVMSAAAFAGGDSAFFVTGLFAGFIGSIKASDLTDGPPPGVKATAAVQTVDGTDYSVFSFYQPGQPYHVRFFVGPQTQEIQRLEITATSGGVQFAATETVLHQAGLPVIPATTFRFTPPPGAAKVRHLPILPFG